MGTQMAPLLENNPNVPQMQIQLTCWDSSGKNKNLVEPGNKVNHMSFESVHYAFIMHSSYLSVLKSNMIVSMREESDKK